MAKTAMRRGPVLCFDLPWAESRITPSWHLSSTKRASGANRKMLTLLLNGKLTRSRLLTAIVELKMRYVLDSESPDLIYIHRLIISAASPIFRGPERAQHSYASR